MNEVIKSKRIEYIEKEIERLVWTYNRIRVEMLKIQEKCCGKGRKIVFYIIELADRPNCRTKHINLKLFVIHKIPLWRANE
jgi:hypothetical protein